jgi:hypothetical protein
MKAKVVRAGMNGGAASGTERKAGGRFGIGKSVPGKVDRARLFGPGVFAPGVPSASLISSVSDAVSMHSIGKRISVRRPAIPEVTTWATVCCGCCETESHERQSQQGGHPERARSHA